MSRKKLVTSLGSGLVAGIIATLVLLNVGTPVAWPRTEASVFYPVKEIKSGMMVALRVYKNDVLVVEKVGDPITDTWINAVASTFFQLYRQGMTFTYTDGSTAGWVYIDAYRNDYRTKGVLAIGTDSYPASTSDTKLYGLFMFQELDGSNYIIQDNSGWINVTVSHTFIANQSVNIAEAGLELKDGRGKYILICRDSFTAISLNVDDGLTIEYDFSIKKDPPFTEYFWGVIINEFLGYQGSNGGSAWNDHKLYTENSGRGDEETKPHDINKIQWALVLSDDAWTPTPSLTTTTTIIDLDMTKVSWSVGSQAFNLHIRLDEYDQNTYDAYGLAFYIYVCIGTGSYGWATYSTKLIAYIRYPSPPVTVDRYTYHIIDLGVNFNA